MRILLCPLSDGGYLYPAITAGRELLRRGHHVNALGRSIVMPVAAEAGLPFVAAEDFGEQRAFSAASWGQTGVSQYHAITRAARDVRADVLVTSILCQGALLAAEALDVPVVVVGFAAHIWDFQTRDDGEPHWGMSRSRRTRECRDLYATVREQAGLTSHSPRWGSRPLLGDALLLRGDPALECPGARLPARARHVGSLAWEPTPGPGVVEQLDETLAQRGKPVVYVHLGRVFGGDDPWPMLNAAFTASRFQAIVEQGRSATPRPAPEADILMVRKPWMAPLIKLAGMVWTSGTSAPVLNALRHGRHLVVSPNGSEQPLLAHACTRAGVAAHLPNNPSTVPSLLLEMAWRDHGLRSHARALGHRLTATDGAGHAADLIERIAHTSMPEEEDHDYATSRP